MKLQDDDRLLTVQEAEHLTGRKVSTFRRDIFLGKIATVRLGRQVRIPLSEIRAMIEAGYRPRLRDDEGRAEHGTGV